MALNIGYVELGGGGVVTIRVYYDVAWLINNPAADYGLAPLVNGPRGLCLDEANTSGVDQHLVIDGVKSQPLDVNIQQGDPVTTGNSRSRTAAQMSQLGFDTRGDLGAITLSGV